MSNYVEAVRIELEQLSSEVIAAKLKMGYFTEEAANVALKILALRGVEYSDKLVTNEETLPPPIGRRVLLFVAQCLSGNQDLSTAFWTLGGAILLFTFASIPIALLLGDGFLIVIGLAGSLLHAISVWRCAKNTKIYAFSQAAKMYAVLVLLPFLIIFGAAVWSIMSLAVSVLHSAG